jgi:hypothetical protein
MINDRPLDYPEGWLTVHISLDEKRLADLDYVVVYGMVPSTGQDVFQLRGTPNSDVPACMRYTKNILYF